jgi:uncharacterized membrane protein
MMNWRDLIVEIIFSRHWLHAMTVTTVLSLSSVLVCLVVIIEQRLAHSRTLEREADWENKYKAMIVEKNYYAEQLRPRLSPKDWTRIKTGAEQ